MSSAEPFGPTFNPKAALVRAPDVFTWSFCIGFSVGKLSTDLVCVCNYATAEDALKGTPRKAGEEFPGLELSFRIKQGDRAKVIEKKDEQTWRESLDALNKFYFLLCNSHLVDHEGQGGDD
jgi:hypothetical protein